MTIECPYCKAVLTSGEIEIGRRVQCLNCGEKFVVDKLEESIPTDGGRTKRLRLVLWIVGAIFVLGIVFLALTSPAFRDSVKSDDAEIPTNSFSYVKNKLAILSLER